MKIYFALVIFGLVSTSYPVQSDSCFDHVEKACLDLGNVWDDKTSCSSLHGGFEGNSENLHKLMSDHFIDSFKFLLMSSKFDSDKVNKMGFTKLYRAYSDKMWENGKKVLSYIIKRGGRTGYTAAGFKMNGLTLGSEVNDEISALSVSLDMMKQRAEDAIKVHAGSGKKNVQGSPKVFDPAISHFLEEKIIAPYADDIRELAGHLNLLGQITRNEKANGFSRHIYDKNL